LDRYRLKPYIHKIKGAKGYALFDILHKKFYRLSPEGDPEKLIEALMEEGLIFNTNGVVPFPIEIDFLEAVNKLNIRELQIRINGRGEDNCWKRTRKDGPVLAMDIKIIERIGHAWGHIPVKKLRIEAEKWEEDKIEKIINEVFSETIDLFIAESPGKDIIDRFRETCLAKNRLSTFHECNKWNIGEIQVDIHNFFYSRQFNPCLGHQVAIDIGGEIRPCLWSAIEIGHITRYNLKDLIVAGTFDKYWMLSKDEIEVCKDCECRYNCLDCRVFGEETGTMSAAKPLFCDFDPYPG